MHVTCWSVASYDELLWQSALRQVNDKPVRLGYKARQTALFTTEVA